MVGKKLLVAAFGLAVALAGASARADVITVLQTFSGAGTLTNGDGTQTLSATATFSLNSTTNQLIIDIANTTTQPNLMSTADLLSGIEFGLSSVTTLGAGSAYALDGLANVGTATDAFDKTVYPFDTAGVSVNNGWGGGALVPPVNGYNEYGAGAGLALGNGQTFDGSQRQGADYTLMSTVSSVANKDGFNSNNPYTYGTLRVTFDITSGTATTSSIVFQPNTVSFLFGTANGGDTQVTGNPPGGGGQTVAPLPATAINSMLLLGLFGAGYTFYRRNKAKLA